MKVDDVFLVNNALYDFRSCIRHVTWILNGQFGGKEQ